MLRPLLALLLQNPKVDKPVDSSPGESATARQTVRDSATASPDRDRLPPRDDSFYLGLCLGHW